MREAAPRVAVRVLPHGEGLPLPAYHSVGAAGADLCAALAPDERIVLEPGARHLIATGIVLELPDGYEGQVRPRSGIALHRGVTVLNAPGTIDSDYRGEVSVLLINCGSEPFEIVRGARIAQLVVAPVMRAVFVETARLTETVRGAGGYGSTGHSALQGDDA
ncbi:dUTP diphosphatase [Methylovirgula ligni]|uniref:Deoxyuridine 5'-triphosphate nucleotidohydrolase n=1 Tax=Methylovirgula ligni TaxID=569860 RepID=A0A3D9YXM6_9HYPH|nr:dUTP diphosphatase [Methylovirgula ligni]QAY94676.1 dUTP diphosphatase [Methylovirgula ligni]REF87442.1 dUTP pyrophosphatase [Methylovirgula ligni]